MQLLSRWGYDFGCGHCGTWWRIEASDLLHLDDGTIGTVCADCLQFGSIAGVPERLVESVRNTESMLYPHPNAPSRKKNATIV